MEFLEGVGFKLKNLQWEGYGYFLEKHNLPAKLRSKKIIRSLKVSNHENLGTHQLKISLNV